MGEKKTNEGHISGQANKPMSRPAHALSHETVAQEIGANTEDGLTDTEAKSRLDEYGRNELDDGPGVQPVKILIRQVANAMMLVKQPTCSNNPHFFLMCCSGPHHGYGRQFWYSFLD
jgi:Na+-exporting ATPase